MLEGRDGETLAFQAGRIIEPTLQLFDLEKGKTKSLRGQTHDKRPKKHSKPELKTYTIATHGEPCQNLTQGMMPQEYRS